MHTLRIVFEIARQTALLQLQNRLFRLLWLALLGVAALVFFIGLNAPTHLQGRHLFAVATWWILMNVTMPWTTMYFGVQAVHGDVEDRTFQYLFIRPVPRFAVLLGKCMAVAGLAALSHAFGMAMVFLAAALHPDRWADGIEWELLVVFAQASLLLAVAYSAVACLFGAFFKRPLVWCAGFILFCQMFLANLPSQAGIRLATIADPVRRFVLDRLDPDPRLARALWPSERNWNDALIGNPLLNLSILVAVALVLALVSYSRSEYDSRERE